MRGSRVRKALSTVKTLCLQAPDWTEPAGNSRAAADPGTRKAGKGPRRRTARSAASMGRACPQREGPPWGAAQGGRSRGRWVPDKGPHSPCVEPQCTGHSQAPWPFPQRQSQRENGMEKNTLARPRSVGWPALSGLGGWRACAPSTSAWAHLSVCSLGRWQSPDPGGRALSMSKTHLLPSCLPPAPSWPRALPPQASTATQPL